MKIIPTGRRVLVERDVVDDTFENSAIVRVESTKDSDQRKQAYGTVMAIADEAQRKQAYGTVMAIADEAYTDVFERKQCGVGDRVIFRAYAGIQAHPEKDNVILLNDQDILGIIIDE